MLIRDTNYDNIDKIKSRRGERKSCEGYICDVKWLRRIEVLVCDPC